MARSVIKIDKNGIPDAAKSVILADIRRFLRNDCEYFWEEKTQELIREMSITSYIVGTNTIIDTLKKEGRL